ncbi:hypothetical protein BCV70DRAFT_39411 [Testicularia cyperi]|uniref:Uncharacterized protein n=1 Tax=Testicularia cyperi TaxID=1882483 RepID=A0A317XL53_9BASI|nr:hypothetical protein BCV70DRAFT_39411 [Testicularia cyperi]
MAYGQHCQRRCASVALLYAGSCYSLLTSTTPPPIPAPLSTSLAVMLNPRVQRARIFSSVSPQYDLVSIPPIREPQLFRLHLYF